MKLCLSDIYVEWHKILKGSYSEIENLQDFASFNVTVTDTTKMDFLSLTEMLTEMFHGAKYWTNLEWKLYFLETIVFIDIMETNFT